MIQVFSFLFSSTFFYIALAVGAVVLVLLLCKAFPDFKPIIKWGISTVVVIVLLLSSIYCGNQIDGYYSASGGIFGKISEAFGFVAEQKEDLTFELKNITLRTDEYGRYSATVTLDYGLNLDRNQNYGILLNGEPTKCESSTANSIFTVFTYDFKANNNEDILRDELHLNLGFSTNATTISIYTAKSEAVRYWKRYFDKNGLTFKIVETDYKRDNSLDVQKAQTQANHSLAKFYYENKLVGVKQVQNGTYVGDAVIEDEALKSEIDGWKVSGEKVSLAEYTINQETRFDGFSAVFLTIKEYSVQTFEDRYNSSSFTSQTDGVITSGYFDSDLTLGEIIEDTSYYDDLKTSSIKVYYIFYGEDGQELNPEITIKQVNNAEIYFWAQLNIRKRISFDSQTTVEGFTICSNPGATKYYQDIIIGGCWLTVGLKPYSYLPSDGITFSQHEMTIDSNPLPPGVVIMGEHKVFQMKIYVDENMHFKMDYSSKEDAIFDEITFAITCYLNPTHIQFATA